MKSQYLKSLCQKYLSLYKTKGSSITLNSLIKLATKASKDAQEAYQKLSEPKTCDSATYATYWIREVILKYLVSRTLKKVPASKSQNNQNNKKGYYIKSVNAYLSFLLFNLPELRCRLIAALPYEERETNWKQCQPLFEELEKQHFVQLAIDRNKIAHRKGYPRYTDMIFAHDQIPQAAYKCFTKNIDKVITYCHQHLPKLSHLPKWFYSELNLPCFICQISSFPKLTIPDGVIEVVGKEYPILQQFQHKLQIKFGNNTRIMYRRQTDTFEIMLQRDGNQHHQTIGLIHELCHMVSMLEGFKKGKDHLTIGKYKTEKAALAIELKILRNLSPIIFRAHLGGILLTFHRVLFELALYANPQQNLPRLYAKMFNHCFPKAKQQTNYLYLLDERIVLKPLSSLLTAVAYVEFLMPMLN